MGENCQGRRLPRREGLAGPDTEPLAFDNDVDFVAIDAGDAAAFFDGLDGLGNQVDLAGPPGWNGECASILLNL